MYLSHTVRTIRADPHPDETVGLVVEVTAEDAADGSDAGDETDAPAAAPAAFTDAVAAVGGRVERALGFDAWLVVVPQTAIEELCALEEVVRIETDATISISPGEPSDPSPGEENGHPTESDDGHRTDSDDVDR